MASTTSPYGSIWRKWDLHFHTPASHDYKDKSVTNEQIVEGLLAAGIEVVCVTDHHIIDVARIQELQRLGADQLTVLPGIECRSELGGSNSVHFIAIFPEDCALDDVWTKLSGKLEITPSDIEKKGGDEKIYCDLADTAQIVRSLDGLISVHAGSKSNSIEGLKSANLINQKIKTDLVRDSIDIYEIGQTKDLESYREKIFPHFDYPVPLVACSDNHDIKSYPNDGFFWLKGDRCFEALRQALYEPEYRVQVSNNRPLEPLLRIQQVVIDLPADTQLKSQSDAHPFCFRGNHKFHFSPHLTCLVGGRGTGKSTLLNLIHEKLYPGKNAFYTDNQLRSDPDSSIESAVVIDNDSERIEIEFLQQNEIEQFAVDPNRFTSAIFARLAKLDPAGTLTQIERKIAAKIEGLKKHAGRLSEYYSLKADIASKTKELHTNKRLVESFENEDYATLRNELSLLATEDQQLRSGTIRLEGFTAAVRSAIDDHPPLPTYGQTAHDAAISVASAEISRSLSTAKANADVQVAKEKHEQIKLDVEKKKEELREFLKGRGLSEENLADVGKASERIAELDQEIPATERRLAALDELLDQFDPSNDLASDYADAVDRLLLPINEKLGAQGAEVRPIRLEYVFDTNRARRSLEEELLKVLDGVDGRKLRTDHLASVLEAVDLTKEPSQTELLALTKTDSKTGQAIHDHFSDEGKYRLFLQMLRVEFLSVESFRLMRVFYDDKPIENSSFGQRCTAAIVVLVLLGNTPIIIDEPEAHLDSSLIAKYLVALVKQKKQERQIIFATHNANFVINGDSELIHVLEVEGDAPSNVTSTTIENLEHRDQLLALEGGQEAFIQRENRYGI